MYKSFLNLFGVAIAVPSLVFVTSQKVQASPELTEESAQNKAEVVHSTPVSHEVNATFTSDLTAINLSEPASVSASETLPPVEQATNSNPRIPIASRIFPSLMQ